MDPAPVDKTSCSLLNNVRYYNHLVVFFFFHNLNSLLFPPPDTIKFGARIKCLLYITYSWAGEISFKIFRNKRNSPPRTPNELQNLAFDQLAKKNKQKIQMATDTERIRFQKQPDYLKTTQGF